MRSSRLLPLVGVAVLSYSFTSAKLRRPREPSASQTGNRLRYGPGRERLVVFIGSTVCVSSGGESLRNDLRTLARSVYPLHGQSGTRPVMVGVSIDYDIREGTKFLTALLPFDEIIVGRGFLNAGSSLFILGPSGSRLSIPQVLVLEREVEIDSTMISVGTLRVLRRIVGADSIHRWVARGAGLADSSDVGVSPIEEKQVGSLVALGDASPRGNGDGSRSKGYRRRAMQ